jgi:hypothetical protein
MSSGHNASNLREQAKLNAIVRRAQRGLAQGREIAAAAAANVPSNANIRAGIEGLQSQYANIEGQYAGIGSALNNALAASGLEPTNENMADVSRELASEIALQQGLRLPRASGSAAMPPPRRLAPLPQPRGAKVAPMPVAAAPATVPAALPAAVPAAVPAPKPRGWGNALKNLSSSLFTRRARVAPLEAKPLEDVLEEFSTKIDELSDQSSNVLRRMNEVRRQKGPSANAKEKNLQALDKEFAAINKKINELFDESNRLLNSAVGKSAKVQQQAQQNFNKAAARISASTNAIMKGLNRSGGITNAEVNQFLAQQPKQRKGGRRVTQRRRRH